MGKSAVLIAGPTASGKSRLALERAQAMGGIIVNADALQVYAGLRVITARPSEADMALAQHRLYGEIDPAMRFSTGDWARAAGRVIAEAKDTPLIFVGGTGLYFEALTKGFADVPEVPPEAVAWAEERIRGMSREERGRLIAAEDPVIAARLRAPDPQRVTRALAVLSAKRLAQIPDVPTMAQAGVPDLEMGAWYGIYMPAKTPPAEQKKLHDAVNKVLDMPNTQKILQAIGAETAPMSQEQFIAFDKAENARYAAGIEKNHIVVQ